MAEADAAKRALESLRICMQFVTDLTFYSVPETLSETMSGSAGFVLMARIFENTARRIYSAVKRMCCPDSSDPTLLFQRLEVVTKLIGGEEYKARAHVEKTENGIKMRFTGLDHLRGNLLNAAPIVGVLAGMIEAAGHKAQPLHGPQTLPHVPPDEWVVYPESVGDDEVVVVIVPPRVGRG